MGKKKKRYRRVISFLQVPSTSEFLTFGMNNCIIGVCLVHCKMFSKVSASSPLVMIIKNVFRHSKYHLEDISPRWKPLPYYRHKNFLQNYFPWCFSSAQFSHSVMSNSLWPHGLQHARLPCPPPTPRAFSNSFPLSRWCHPTISSSVILFSSCLQPFPVVVLITFDRSEKYYLTSVQSFY